MVAGKKQYETWLLYDNATNHCVDVNKDEDISRRCSLVFSELALFPFKEGNEAIIISYNFTT